MSNLQFMKDAGEGYDYKKGGYSVRNFRLQREGPKELIIQQFKDGTYITPYNSFKINLNGLPFKIAKIEVDNEKVPLESVRLNGDNSIEVDKNFNVLHLMSR